MKNNLILSSLALDLKRAALGLNRGSERMANRFLEEALKRKQELNTEGLKRYVKNMLVNFDKLMKEKDRDKKAEDCLMYSTLIQNFVVSKDPL